jgi:hypothetical protein
MLPLVWLQRWAKAIHLKKFEFLKRYRRQLDISKIEV